MALRTLLSTTALDSLWEEVVYTWARLKVEPAAADLPPVFEELATKIQSAWAGQRTSWQAALLGQATIDAADDRLDDVVRAFGRALLASVASNALSFGAGILLAALSVFDAGGAA